jgi:hypothetical protein
VDGAGGEDEEDRMGEAKRSEKECKTERLADVVGEGETKSVERLAAMDEVEGEESGADLGKKTVTGAGEEDTGGRGRLTEGNRVLWKMTSRVTTIFSLVKSQMR